MKQTLGSLLLCLMALGCRLPEEREALRPLPEKGVPLAYAELFHRAKVQANAALDAFYADNWLELEQTAQVLEQTAIYLPRASDQPKELKKTITQESETLKLQAVRLRDAARAKSVPNTNETLQRIHLTIRSLRPPE